MVLAAFILASLPPSACGSGGSPDSMLNALRYYWIISKGHRLSPWKSPYIQWRVETFFGHQAADLTAGQFFRLMWRERARMERFLDWVADQRASLRSSK